MFTGIEHTAIASPNPLRLAEWYVEHLEFAIGWRPPNSNTVFVRAKDGSMIEIIESNDALGPLTMRDPGLRHLAIAVTNFDAALAHLRAKSVNFLTAPEKHFTNSLVFFTDCDGNILHLLHREQPIP